jgi:aminoglycoside phosphotransferase
VPAVDVLLGADAIELLGAALPSAEILDSRVAFVRYKPGSSIVVQYRVDVAEDPAGSSAKLQREIMVVAAAGLSTPVDVTVVSDDIIEVSLWTYPADPFLPGIARVAQRGTLEQLVAPVGVDRIIRAPRARAYRATRRAVFEAHTPDRRLFVKVVRPHEAAGLQERHTWLAGRWPAARSLGWSRELGAVVLEAVPGATLRSSLERGAQSAPDPSSLVDLLDRLPGGSQLATVAGPVDRLEARLELLSAVTPHLSNRLRRLTSAIRSAQHDDGAPVPVHGDFHAAQIMVHEGQITGVVDVDTLGVGRRADDLATALGHLATLTTMPTDQGTLAPYLERMQETFERVIDPADLRARTAAAILGLASGPFRVFEPNWPEAVERRVDLAERWLASALR